MEYHRNVWNKINVDKKNEYDRRWHKNDFGINDREQEYLKVKSRHLRISISLHVRHAAAPLRPKSGKVLSFTPGWLCTNQ